MRCSIGKLPVAAYVAFPQPETCSRYETTHRDRLFVIEQLHGGHAGTHRIAGEPAL
jgi:hypothetical protein